MLQDLGLEDIARMDGWVKTEQPQPSPSFLNPSSSPPLDSGSPTDATPASTDASSSSTDPTASSSSTDEDPAAISPITDSDFESDPLPPLASASEVGLQSSSHDQPQLLQPVEQLSDDMYTYSAAPTASAAVPVFHTDYSASGDFSTHGVLGQPSSESASPESELAEPANAASISTDSEEDEEGSLLDRCYAAHPDELCR